MQSFVQKHGEDALQLALESGHLFDPAMRAGSRMALQHSGDFHRENLPYALIVTRNPQASKHGERTEVQLITGSVNLELGSVGRRT